MVSKKIALAVDCARSKAISTIFPLPPIISSYQAGWKNIQLVHYIQPAWEVPELSCIQHAIVMSNWKRSTEVELAADGKVNRMFCTEDRSGCIEIIPANVPLKASWTQEVEFTHLYLEPTFISQVAYESVNPDRVEFTIMLQQPSPLLWNMGAALRSILAEDEKNSCFYAESMATALAAHLLTYYAISLVRVRINTKITRLCYQLPDCVRRRCTLSMYDWGILINIIPANSHAKLS